MSVKEMAKQVIDSLPEGASIEDIMHALYVRAKFEKGEQEIRSGRGIPHERAKKDLEKWQR